MAWLGVGLKSVSIGILVLALGAIEIRHGETSRADIINLVGATTFLGGTAALWWAFAGQIGAYRTILGEPARPIQVNRGSRRAAHIIDIVPVTMAPSHLLQGGLYATVGHLSFQEEFAPAIVSAARRNIERGAIHHVEVSFTDVLAGRLPLIYRIADDWPCTLIVPSAVVVLVMVGLLTGQVLIAFATVGGWLSGSLAWSSLWRGSDRSFRTLGADGGTNEAWLSSQAKSRTSSRTRPWRFHVALVTAIVTVTIGVLGVGTAIFFSEQFLWLESTWWPLVGLLSVTFGGLSLYLLLGWWSATRTA